MVVGTDEEVHPFQRVIEVQALALEDRPVAVAGAGMDRDDDDLGLVFQAQAVDVLLDEGNEREEVHPAPEALVQPGFHVGVGVAEHEHFQAVLPEDLVCREVGFAVVRADGVAGEEGDAVAAEVAGDAVIDRMAGLVVVVADRHRIVAHIGREARVEVGRLRVDVVEIVRRVVSLEAVAGVDQQHVFRTCRRADAVDAVVHGEEGRPGGAGDVVFVEPAAVDVVGREDAQVIGAVFRAAGGQQKRRGEQQG